ncbi:MAG: hypothetical protein IJ210_10315 [Clostridia bacterium]|nr:hypothetical protein [Clostridia bacterium]
MDRDIIPSPEVQEQSEVYGVDSPYLEYFKVMASDWRYVDGRIGSNNYAVTLFWSILGQMVVYGPGNGPDGPIDYNAVWETIRKRERISSEKASRIRKQRFIDLCQEYEAKVKKSHDAMEKTKKANDKKKAGGGAAKKSLKESKRGEPGADPEGGGSPGSIPDNLPEGVQRSPVIVKMWQKYRPLSFGEAEKKLLQVIKAAKTDDWSKLKSLFSGPDKQFCAEAVADFPFCDEFYAYASGSDTFSLGNDDYAEVRKMPLISTDEQLLLLIIKCFMSYEKYADCYKACLQYGFLRDEEGCSLLPYVDEDSIVDSIMASYEYDAESRLWKGF